MKYGCRWRLRPKFRPLALLDMSAWTFILVICTYGILTWVKVQLFQNPWTQKFKYFGKFELSKLVVCLQIINNFNLNGQLSLDELKINQRSYNNPNSAFWGWLSMESQPQNPEFRNNPENFHPCIKKIMKYRNLVICALAHMLIWRNKTSYLDTLLVSL